MNRDLFLGWIFCIFHLKSLLFIKYSCDKKTTNTNKKRNSVFMECSCALYILENVYFYFFQKKKEK